MGPELSDELDEPPGGLVLGVGSTLPGAGEVEFELVGPSEELVVVGKM